MFGNVIFMLLSICLMSCANPKYFIQDKALVSQVGRGEPTHPIRCELKFSNKEVCLAWYWEKITTPFEEGSLIVKLFRPNRLDGSPVLITPIQLNLRLTLWMPSMNHGSTPTISHKIDVGTYRIEEVFFIMPGEWDLRFQLLNQDNIKDEVIVEIRI